MKELVEPKVTCPNCWYDFYGTDAMYISQHPELKGDSVLGDYAPQRLTPYEIDRDRDGHPLDTKGWTIFDRACPRCHLQIPVDLLEERPKFVSIVGAPRSGKTYFLNVMLHNLSKILARQFSYSLNICDSHDKELFAKNEQKLFFATDPREPVMLDKTQEEGAELYNNVKLDGVNVQLPKPFVFTLKHIPGNTLRRDHENQLSVVIYDNAGESFFFNRANDGQNRSTQHLGESDAVLFAYDLLLAPEALSRLRSISNDPQLSLEKPPSRQQDILTAVVHRMRKHSHTPEKRKLDAALAICVQKFDVWKPLLDHCKTSDGQPVIDQTSIEYFAKHSIAALDTQEINVISQVVRELIWDISPEFAAIAEANFSKVRYFPVSALGQSPVQDGSFLKIAPINLHPFRAEHPMLWLLRDWKLIHRTRSTRPNPKEFPVAEVDAVLDDGIRIICPESRRPVVLDREYAGSQFFDSNSRTYCWIPEIPNDLRIESALPNSHQSSD